MTSYTGRSCQPRREPIVYRCACGERFAAEVWRAISAEDAALRTRLIEGDLNRVRCPSCGAASDVQVSVVYHDPAGRLVYVAPQSERHRELALRAELFAMLAADQAPPPDYVLAAELVFGAAGLSELLARPVAASAPALEAEAAPVAPVEGDTAQHVFVTAESVSEAGGRVAVARPAIAPASPAPVVETPTPPVARAAPPAQPEVEATQPRASVVVPDPRTAVIERWIAARERPTALFVDDRVVVCAAMPASTLEHFVAREGRRVRITLRPQLHRMTSFPLVVLTFVSGEEVERPDESRVIHVPLDLSRAAHRVALDQLQRRCSIELELFDSEYLPVVSHTITAPFEDHLRHLLAEAKQAMDKLPLATRDFDRALKAFLGVGYDRVGRTAIDLPSLDEVLRGTPSQVRGALAVVGRWGEAAAESYLLEIRGFPLSLWRKLSGTTVRRAVEVGLFVPRNLAERVVRRSEEALELPPWAELIDLLVRRFAELSARLKPNDLPPIEEAANWELLLREAEAHGIAVDAPIQRLADAAFARAGGRPSRRARAATRARTTGAHSTEPAPAAKGRIDSSDGGKQDETAAWLARLEDRDHRLEAAMTLASRRDPAHLPALFVVLRRFSRAESAVLLPRLAAFGAAAERGLVEGLRSKKAFMRQGCALALGQLARGLAEASPAGAGSPSSAIAALVGLLFDEPTDIWNEVARALGDVGAPAVAPLVARLQDERPEERDRIIHALAHIVARSTATGMASGRAAVEILATGRDPLAANAARRALVLAPEVLTAHEAVQSDRREQTLVRAFTRRFYDVLRVPAGGQPGGAEAGNELADIPELDDDDLLLTLDSDDDVVDEIDDLLEPDGPDPDDDPEDDNDATISAHATARTPKQGSLTTLPHKGSAASAPRRSST